MEDTDKSKKQLIEDLETLRARVSALEKSVTEHERLEAALAESEAKYHDLYENAPDMFVSVEANTGLILQCNQTLVTATGYAKEEIIGRHVSELYHPDSEEDRQKVFEQFVDTGEVRDAELQLRRKDGSKIDVSLNVSGVRDEQGNLLHSVSIWRDITRHKQMDAALRASEERFRGTLDSMLEGCQILDFDLRYQYVNDTGVIHGRKTREEKLGQYIGDVYPGIENTELYTALKRCLEERTPHRMENEFGYASGDIGWFELSIQPVPEGVFLLSIDVTERKRAQNSLEYRNRELEAYNHTIAHDLKAPLTNIIGFADFLLKEMGDPEPDARELLEFIQEDARRMAGMIDDLLMLAKLRDPVEVIEPVSMKPVIDTALERFVGPISSRSIEVKVPPRPPRVLGSSAWLEEVIANLVNNAIKYISEDNPAPKINIIGKRQGKIVRYEVRDNGVGIDPEDQERLFEMFSRFRPEKAQGHGLGLSIVKRIITNLSGEVGVDSVPGEGSTFWFTLPAP
jgi:PAS domain S-box-containing protein